MFGQLPFIFIIFCDSKFGSIDEPINECIIDPSINIDTLAIKAAIFNLSC
jgi:hypothetical protein